VCDGWIESLQKQLDELRSIKEQIESVIGRL
jgi:hypothetical protein